MDHNQDLRRLVTYRKSKWKSRSDAYVQNIKAQLKAGKNFKVDWLADLTRYITSGNRLLLQAAAAGCPESVGRDIREHQRKLIAVKEAVEQL